MGRTPLRVLVVEDSVDDYFLVLRELQRGGYEPTSERVETAETLRAALADQVWDVIIADYAMPHLSGMKALEIVRATGLDVPFILVSGTVGEEVAVEAMIAGAQDYLMKHNLVRLPHAVGRELREVAERRGRREAEAAVEAAATEWRATFDAISDGVVVVDAEGAIVRCNVAMSHFLGRSFDEMVGRHWHELVPDLDQAPGGCPVCLARETLSRQVAEVQVGDRWFRMAADPVLDAEGHLTRVVHTMTDVTANRRMTDALRESEQRYRGLVDNIAIGIAVISPDMRVLSMNPRMAEWFPEANAAERPLCYAAFNDPPRSEPCSYCPTIKALRSGVVYEGTTETPAGSEVRFYRIVASPLRNATGEVVAAIEMVEDITEQKRADERSRQASKLEAIGTLAGGVAHDFNNLLTGIIGYSDLLLGGGRLSEVDAQDLQQVRELGDRAAGLVRQLLAFSRRQTLEPQIVDPNALIENLMRMLRRIIGEDVQLRLNLAQDAGTIRVDPGQMEQVIVNLAANARDAMPDGGVLTIETRAVNLEGTEAEDAQAEPGPYCLLTMGDTGHGMDEATAARIFEPFFSTKAAGQGTGLGLATVYGIVKQHGGGITVKSAPGCGTTFRICLPRVEQKATEPAREDRVSPVPTGTETILVVEDEDSVRRIVETILTQQGYVVLSARTSAEAWALLQVRGAEIALLLSDVVMPGMSGPALYETLSTLQPSLKVLFMSGHSAHPALRGDVAGLEAPFVQKPFSPADLAHKVRQALDG